MATGSNYPYQNDHFPNKNTGDNFTLGEINRWTSGIERAERYFTGGFYNLQRLSKQVASSSLSLDFSGLFTSDYDSYLIKFIDITSQFDQQNLEVRVSQYGSFQSVGVIYFGAATIVTEGSSGVSPGGTGNEGANYIPILGNIGNGAAFSTSGLIFFYNPLSVTSCKLFLWSVSTYINSSLLQHINGSGSFTTNTEAIDGVQLLLSNGNIVSGSATLYGIRV